ncbi:MAG: DedA family protein [Deltaproteobacteria bacterium]|nr:DedA family protein [Deltaproteobacteria bacterium]
MEDLAIPVKKEAPVQSSSKNILRKLYDWVLQWGKHPQAVVALFILAVAESSFFPIPPDVLLIAICFSLTRRSFYFALICTIGSVIGGGIGYLIGYSFMDWIGRTILEWYGMGNRFDQIRDLYVRYDAWIVLTAAFTPIPYKIFTIAAGACSISLVPFFTASLIGRGGRFFLVAAFIYFCGERAKVILERYFNWITFGIIALLILGFLLVRWVL